MALNKCSIISTNKVINGQIPLFSTTNWTLLDNLNKLCERIQNLFTSTLLLLTALFELPSIWAQNEVLLD